MTKLFLALLLSMNKVCLCADIEGNIPSQKNLLCVEGTDAESDDSREELFTKSDSEQIKKTSTFSAQYTNVALWLSCSNSNTDETSKILKNLLDNKKNGLITQDQYEYAINDGLNCYEPISNYANIVIKDNEIDALSEKLSPTEFNLSKEKILEKLNKNVNPYVVLTPLKAAILNGKLESATLLIENGANINYRDFLGKSILYYSLKSALDAYNKNQSFEGYVNLICQLRQKGVIETSYTGAINELINLSESKIQLENCIALQEFFGKNQSR